MRLRGSRTRCRAPMNSLRACKRRRACRVPCATSPLPLRQVMVLAFEGLSNEDIASVLGLTAGNVGVRLHRGKALLKAALGEKA